MAQTRTVAPASGMPRELKTMSSLREPCACAGPTTPGTTCSASASSAQRNSIVVARLKRDAIFDRIIAVPVPFIELGSTLLISEFRARLCSLTRHRRHATSYDFCDAYILGTLSHRRDFV